MKAEIKTSRLNAISDRSRLEIITIIEDREFTASDIAYHLEKSQSLTAYHLKILVAAGLLHRRSKGRFRYYRLASPDVSILSATVRRIIAETV